MRGKDMQTSRGKLNQKPVNLNIEDLEDLIAWAAGALTGLEESTIQGPAYLEVKREIYEKGAQQATKIVLDRVEAWATARAAVTKYDLLKYLENERSS